MELEITVNRKRYKTAHIFKPITDEQYFEFCKRKKAVAKLAGEGEVQFTSEDENLQAAAWLWDQIIIKREGYKEPKNWREQVSLQEKKVAIKELLIIGIDKDEDKIVDAEPGELFDQTVENTAKMVVLQCLYRSEVINTRHYFAIPSAKDVEEFNRITLRSIRWRTALRWLFKIGTSAEVHVLSQAKALAELYDKLIKKTEGYKGRVPAYHKESAVSEVFAKEVEAREKK